MSLPWQKGKSSLKPVKVNRIFKIYVIGLLTRQVNASAEKLRSSIVEFGINLLILT